MKATKKDLNKLVEEIVNKKLNESSAESNNNAIDKCIGGLVQASGALKNIVLDGSDYRLAKESIRTAWNIVQDARK